MSRKEIFCKMPNKTEKQNVKRDMVQSTDLGITGLYPFVEESDKYSLRQTQQKKG